MLPYSASLHKKTFRVSHLWLLLVCLLIGLTTPTGAAQGEQETPPAAPSTHVVQEGETLSEIAKEEGISLSELMRINGIVDADSVFAGQMLTLPESSPPAVPAETSERTHVVQSGETLSEIAKRYALPLSVLLRLNGLLDADQVRVGQVLQLPVPVESDEPAIEPAATAASSSTSSAITLNRTYSVRFGDTPGLIALRMGVDEYALRMLNALDDSPGGGLTAGQTLLLPATGDDLRVQTPQEQIVVQPGETLSEIAKQAGLSLSELMQANRITNPDAIAVGQPLTIPPRPLDDGGTTSAPVGPEQRGFFYYTVQPGDTLSEIAREFDIPMLALVEYNDLPDEATVYLGLELRIPFGAPRLPKRLPPVPTSGTSFLVSLSRQQCWVFAGSDVVHRWNCSTGYGEWITRTGIFAVQSKIENAKSSAYRLDMPYWLGIYDVGEYENGIHGLPVSWETGEKIWSSLVGKPATFGCAMLDDPDAATLFELAYLGMPVYIIQ